MPKSKNQRDSRTLARASIVKTNTRNTINIRKTRNTRKIRRRENIDTERSQELKMRESLARYQRMSSRIQAIMTKMKVMRTTQLLQEELRILRKKEEGIRGEAGEPRRAQPIMTLKELLKRERNEKRKRGRRCGKRKSQNRRCKT